MIGHRIRDFRKEKGLTQAELAQNIVSRSYLSSIEKGYVFPSFDVVKKLADKLECSIDAVWVTDENINNLVMADAKKKLSKLELSYEEDTIVRIEDINSVDISLLNQDEQGIYNWIKGKHYFLTQDTTLAVEHFEKSLQLLKDSRYRSHLVRTLHDFGYLYYTLNDFKAAFHMLNNAYKEIQVNNVTGTGRYLTLLNLGIVHGRLGENYSAIRLLLEVLEVSRRTGIKYHYGRLLTALAICYRSCNSYDLAEEYYNKAKDYYQIENNDNKIAEINHNLGSLYFYRKEFTKSIQHFKKAISYFETIVPNSIHIYKSYVFLAEVYYEINELKKGISICENALKDNPPTSEKIKTLKILGKLYAKIGDISNAKAVLFKAIKLVNSESSLQRLEKDIYTELGYLYYKHLN
ncbi:helix-turn-helix domain-containing protein [Bacillus infantis]|uniref:helix-turn-helix domain-containing protein n=1 Tax=Bacillus infantis TaxID=324767 RepID=UPI003CEC3771